ncbi:MAG: RsmD family RNA methyltransferase [Chloroflexi bacterium]|nr:RsmD family RNA methyltransferase [Chloroflexota bacterium]
MIAGKARGRELFQPRGATRPTSARLREALFSMLDAGGMLQSPALDLYAGSGALGIEALSRGVAQCTFVESDGRTCGVIADNLERVGLAGGTVSRGTVGRWHPPADARYALVLADPPYDDAAPWAAIEASLTDALTAEATIAVEHEARRTPPDQLAGRQLWRDRRHGDSAVAIYRPATAPGEVVE